MKPTETLSFNREQFLELRRAHPGVDGFLMGMLATHLRRADAQLIEALFVPVERRLLRRLLYLCTAYESSGGEVEIPLTQEDLASLAGTSRATANRVLGQLEDDKVVSLAPNRIQVTTPTSSPAALAESPPSREAIVAA